MHNKNSVTCSFPLLSSSLLPFFSKHGEAKKMNPFSKITSRWFEFDILHVAHRQSSLGLKIHGLLLQRAAPKRTLHWERLGTTPPYTYTLDPQKRPAYMTSQQNVP